MAKLLENTFRMINIGMVNELAIMCERMGVDVWEVIDAAATKPFGFMKFTPGPGLGGHCIPIDPLYLSWKMKAYQYTARLYRTGFRYQHQHAALRCKSYPGCDDDVQYIGGSHCLVLGAAYKPDIDDIRESPALDVIGLLQKKGAVVDTTTLHPNFENPRREVGMHSVPDLMAAVRAGRLCRNHNQPPQHTIQRHLECSKVHLRQS